MATVDLARRAEIGRLKRAKTRATIIDGALGLIRQKGPDAPTIEDFIAAAEVARGTFYNHFKTKDELLLALGSHVADAIDAQILPLFEGVDDPAQRIAIAIRQFVAVVRERPEWGEILVRTLHGAEGGWSEGMRRGVLADILEGKRLGLFHFDSTQAAVAIGIGALAMAIRTSLTQQTTAAFGETMAMMCLRALGMDTAQAERVARLPLGQAAVESR